MTGTALATRTVAALRRFWADRLGVDVSAFDRDGVTVGTGSEAGVELFVRGDARLVGAPERLADPLRVRADDLVALDLDDRAAARDLVSEAIAAVAESDAADAGHGAADGGGGASDERGVDGDGANDGRGGLGGDGERGGSGLPSVAEVHGPAFYGYVDADAFEPVEERAGATTRPLTDDDRDAYERLRESVVGAEWSAGGPAFDPGRTVGRFVGGELVALASYELWANRIAHVGVVTRPDARGEGNGRAAVSRTTADALDAGLLPQYRTLDEWPWSVALAAGVGYERFATSLFVELG